MNIITDSASSGRFYYLDWLRIIAFSILIFEHSAEIFVSWKFWIKNAETSPFLTYLIAFFLPWRMPILFIISGAVVALSFKRKSALAFLKERFIRLMLPLTFALLIIIPPQIYFIRLNSGYQDNFLTFYRQILSLDLHWSPKGNIHFLHLWYLAFLFAYCLILLPLLCLAKTNRWQAKLSGLCRLISQPPLLFLFGFVLVLPYYFLSYYHSDSYKATFIYYFPFFLCGALLWPDLSIRNSVQKHRNISLILAMLLTLNLYALSFESSNPRSYFLNITTIESFPVFVTKSLNLWLWVLAILGFAMRYLSQNSPGLQYATRAVYPFYILHQTIIVITGYYIVQLSASISYKLAMVTFLSLLFMTILYETLIKKTKFTRIVFGITWNQDDTLKTFSTAKNKPFQNTRKDHSFQHQ